MSGFQPPGLEHGAHAAIENMMLGEIDHRITPLFSL